SADAIIAVSIRLPNDADMAVSPWGLQVQDNATIGSFSIATMSPVIDLVSCVSSLLINAGAGVRSNCARGSAVAANGLLSPPRGSTDPRLGAQSWPEISSKIVDLRRVICASPSYLARHGWPAEHADLARHACLILSRNPGSATWSFRVNCKLARIDVK